MAVSCVASTSYRSLSVSTLAPRLSTFHSPALRQHLINDLWVRSGSARPPRTPFGQSYSLRSLSTEQVVHRPERLITDDVPVVLTENQGSLDGVSPTSLLKGKGRALPEDGIERKGSLGQRGFGETQKASPSQSAATASTTARPRRSLNLRSNKAAISLTPSAISRLRTLLSDPTNPQLIRISVRNRGCAGMAYHLEYVSPPGGKFDEVVEQDGVRVLIDSKALFSIIGSEMDWVEDRMSARFVFKNPNVKDSCGCGESFTI